jgi:hypothetical protein
MKMIMLPEIHGVCQVAKKLYKTVERPASERLMEDVHMQGFRNRGPARRVGSPSEARTNSEE